MRATRANRQRSLLFNQKNRPENPVSKPKKPTSKEIPIKVNKKQKSQQKLTKIKSETCLLSPHQIKTQPLDSSQPFSKSEEETKAEEFAIYSPHKNSQWKGILEQYREDIMNYLLSRQKKTRIDTSYLYLNSILTPKLRIYLVRHIFKLYNRYDLKRLTLHLAVAYMDRYFVRNPFLKDQMEGMLVAQACLYIAMKSQEIYYPSLNEWVSTQFQSQIVKLEAQILKVLDFDINLYTVEHHLDLLRSEDKTDNNTRLVYSQAISDLTLFDANIRQSEPSRIAEAIWAMANDEEVSDYRAGLALKWMIQRNGQSLVWLQDKRYGCLQKLTF